MKALSLLAVVVCALSCQPPLPAPPPAPAVAKPQPRAHADAALPLTRVFILRHAEKADDMDWNTDLKAPQGFDRARAWAEVLVPLSPRALFASNLQRTQHTLQPTAEKLSLPVQIRPEVEPSRKRPTVDDTLALAKEILSEHHHQVVVVCWHTPYVMDLAAALGVPKESVPDWDHATFDRLWEVTVSPNGVATLARI